MVSAGGGVIVNVSFAVGSYFAVPGLSAYASAKAAIGALTRTAAKEYIGDADRLTDRGALVSPASLDSLDGNTVTVRLDDRELVVRAVAGLSGPGIPPVLLTAADPARRAHWAETGALWLRHSAGADACAVVEDLRTAVPDPASVDICGGAPEQHSQLLGDRISTRARPARGGGR